MESDCGVEFFQEIFEGFVGNEETLPLEYCKLRDGSRFLKRSVKSEKEYNQTKSKRQSV